MVGEETHKMALRQCKHYRLQFRGRRNSRLSQFSKNDPPYNNTLYPMWQHQFFFFVHIYLEYRKLLVHQFLT
jgi:hypothetical protein